MSVFAALITPLLSNLMCLPDPLSIVCGGRNVDILYDAYSACAQVL